MASPLFLSVEDVIEIHADQIQRYGGSLGIRDLELLHSALGMPEAGVGDQYLHAGLFEMATAYLYHIVQNHPFIDGNKRTAFVAVELFLFLNHHLLEAADADCVLTMLRVAEGSMSEEDFAAWIRQNSRKRRKK